MNILMLQQISNDLISQQDDYLRSIEFNNKLKRLSQIQNDEGEFPILKIIQKIKQLKQQDENEMLMQNLQFYIQCIVFQTEIDIKNIIPILNLNMELNHQTSILIFFNLVQKIQQKNMLHESQQGHQKLKKQLDDDLKIMIKQIEQLDQFNTQQINYIFQQIYQQYFLFKNHQKQLERICFTNVNKSNSIIKLIIHMNQNNKTFFNFYLNNLIHLLKITNFNYDNHFQLQLQKNSDQIINDIQILRTLLIEYLKDLQSQQIINLNINYSLNIIQLISQQKLDNNIHLEILIYLIKIANHSLLKYITVINNLIFQNFQNKYQFEMNLRLLKNCIKYFKGNYYEFGTFCFLQRPNLIQLFEKITETLRNNQSKEIVFLFKKQGFFKNNQKQITNLKIIKNNPFDYLNSLSFETLKRQLYIILKILELFSQNCIKIEQKEQNIVKFDILLSFIFSNYKLYKDIKNINEMIVKIIINFINNVHIKGEQSALFKEIYNFNETFKNKELQNYLNNFKNNNKVQQFGFQNYENLYVEEIQNKIKQVIQVEEPEIQKKVKLEEIENQLLSQKQEYEQQIIDIQKEKQLLQFQLENANKQLNEQYYQKQLQGMQQTKVEIVNNKNIDQQIDYSEESEQIENLPQPNFD